MRKFLYLSALLGLLFLGCESNNLDISRDKPETEETKVIKQYISGSELDFYKHYTIGTDTTLIYVYGSKDNKLYVKGFTKASKQNFLTWVSKSDLYAGSDLPVDKINEVLIDQVYKDQNDYFILMYNIGSDSDIYQKLLFLSNGKEVLKAFNLTDFSNQFTFGKNITTWYDNSFLINTYIDFGNNQGVEVLRCYNFEGEVLFDTAKPKNIGSYSSNSYLPLSTDESLFLEKNIIKRHNLRTDSILWESIKIESIPDNALINNVNFEVINSDYTKCTINITLIGGEKKTVSLKINNLTGDYQNI